MIDVILFLIACVLFALAALTVTAGRFNLIAAGLFCLALDWFLHAIT